MSNLIERHRRACDGFARVADAVPSEKWDRPTPCTDWDARALVEHVIGFHDFLLLRPLGRRAERPRDDPAARWTATAAALFTVLAEPGVLDRSSTGRRGSRLGNAAEDGPDRRIVPASTATRRVGA